MKLANLEIEQIESFPHGAIVAFAARCARRVDSLVPRHNGNPRREDRRAEAANEAGGPRIRRPGGNISAWVIPTNEELMIARHTIRLTAA